MVVLVIYWLTLSGYFDHTILYVTGALSVICVVWLMSRMKILDTETVPYVHGKSIGYFFWVFKEIGKANVAVVKAVLSPDMAISPTLVKVKMNQSTDLGRTVFANTITLTPGTISVDLGEDKILVHALLEEMTDANAFAEMSERASWSVSDPTTATKKVGGK